MGHEDSLVSTIQTMIDSLTLDEAKHTSRLIFTDQASFFPLYANFLEPIEK